MTFLVLLSSWLPLAPGIPAAATLDPVSARFAGASNPLAQDAKPSVPDDATAQETPAAGAEEEPASAVPA